MHSLGLPMKRKRKGENLPVFSDSKAKHKLKTLVFLLLILPTAVDIPRQSLLEQNGISNTSPFPNLDPSFCQQKWMYNVVFLIAHCPCGLSLLGGQTPSLCTGKILNPSSQISIFTGKLEDDRHKIFLQNYTFWSIDCIN